MALSRLLASLSALALSGLLTAGGAMAQALPTGGTVQAGSATIGQPDAGTLRIDQTSQNAILHFDSFSIGTANRVHFANGTGATLNRVTGRHVSEIDVGLGGGL